MPLQNTQLSSPLPLLPSLIALGAGLLFAAGAVIALVHPAMLVVPGSAIGDAAHIYAGYFASRNLSIALLLFVFFARRSGAALSCLLMLAAAIQLIDAFIDGMEGRWIIVPGVLVLALIFFFASTRIGRRSHLLP